MHALHPSYVHASQLLEIAGGNHEIYGSYGSPGLAQGLAYKDLPAKITAEAPRELVATAIAELAVGGSLSKSVTGLRFGLAAQPLDESSRPLAEQE